MSSDMISSFDRIDAIPCDDVFVKPSNKTLRKRYNGKYIHTGDTVVYCKRVPTNVGIPITKADAYITIGKMFAAANFNSFSARKHGMYDKLIDSLEENCISKKTISYLKNTRDAYSAYGNHFGTDMIHYTLPVTDHLDLSSLCVYDIYDPIACEKPLMMKKNKMTQQKSRRIRSWKYYENQKKIQDHRGKFIRINGNQYSVNSVYKRIGAIYVPIVIHKPSDAEQLSPDEKSVRYHITAGIAITLNFSKDTILDGLVLQPEPMKFEYVYEDVNRRSQRTTDRKFIQCLVNEPGYISKFKLFFRSTDSDGQWIELGIFDGNDSDHDATKIVFDEPLTVKELRIVPLTHVGSFEKIVVTPFAKSTSIEKLDTEETLTYVVEVPRSLGETYTLVPDKCVRYTRERRNLKGDLKTRRREFMDICDA
jgi:hypothetical protein